MTPNASEFRQGEEEGNSAISRHEDGYSGPFICTGQRALPFALAALPPGRAEIAAVSRVVTNAEARSWVVGIIEFVAVTAASVASGLAYGYTALGSVDSFYSFFSIGVTAGLLHWGIGILLRAGHPQAVSRLRDRIRETLLSWMFAYALLTFFMFVLKTGHTFSRGATLLFLITGFLAAVGVRGFLLPVLCRALRGKAFSRRNALVIAQTGTNPSLAAVLHELKSGGVESFVIGIDATSSLAQWDAERKIILNAVTAAARSMRAGDIYLCSSGIPIDRLKSLKVWLSLIPRTTFVVPDEAVSALLHSRYVSALGDCVAVEIQREPLSGVERVLKRTIDFCGALSLLVFTMPLFAVIAIAIKLDSSGPVLFRQKRLGLGGRPFDILKFRTMTVLENGREVIQVRKSDPRVTRVGEFLRKRSLDELPQLLNVLKGEMSLVGPRPHAITHDEEYARTIENYEIRQHVRPGITGWAQVRGFRGETPSLELMRRRIESDLWYAKNASIWLDMRILLLSIFKVFGDPHAY
jgi:Undecaprenyl-phosphate glucose phosphotransferase